MIPGENPQEQPLCSDPVLQKFPSHEPMRRVTKLQPCPVCGKPDWCLIATDGTAAICARLKSNKQAGEAGWLHLRVPGVNRNSRKPRYNTVRLQPEIAPIDLGGQAYAYLAAGSRDHVERFASDLGLRVNSSRAFCVGWADEYQAYSIPLFDPITRQIIGIRLRKEDGTKFSVRGGKEGLFAPYRMWIPDDVLVIAEGATDAIAAHSIGFLNTIGRPSCTGGKGQIEALVKLKKPTDIVIVADADEPGQRGANELSLLLALHCTNVKILTPPSSVKDLRAWVNTGLTRANIESDLSSIKPCRLSIREGGCNHVDR